jgi:hypothetical protein
MARTKGKEQKKDDQNKDDQNKPKASESDPKTVTKSFRGMALH